MPLPGLDILQAEIAALRPLSHAGRITGLAQGLVEIEGLPDTVALGDVLTLRGHSATHLAEVVAVGPDGVSALSEGGGAGLSVGDGAQLEEQGRIAPHDGWLGRIVDPFGQPLDGRRLLRGPDFRDVQSGPPPAAARRGLGPRLETGLSVFNTLLPLARGQRLGLFAGTGVGKSTLLARFATGVAADVVVIAMIGERGRELRAFTDKVLGPDGLRRTVVVAATSDQSPMARRRCAGAAMAVAEYFRDQGRQVLFLADSITRFAEAHREIALAAGEAASLEGFPPSVAPAIAQLCERAGPGSGASGDITAIFSVLVAASDMDGPVADILRGVLDGHVVLDRRIAERGRFPAIDLLRSVSRSLPEAASEGENGVIADARGLLGIYERSEMMVRAGLYRAGSDPELDRAILIWPELDRFVSERARAEVPCFDRLRQILRQGNAPPSGQSEDQANGQ